MLLHPSPFRKKQQGSIGPAVVWVSAALSNPLSSEYLPHHDGLLGRWALQETLLSRPAQPAGFDICQDIFQDDRGLESGTQGGRRGWWEGFEQCRRKSPGRRKERKANEKRRGLFSSPFQSTSKTGYMYFKNNEVWKDRGSIESRSEMFTWCSPNQRQTRNPSFLRLKDSGQSDWNQPEDGV